MGGYAAQANWVVPALHTPLRKMRLDHGFALLVPSVVVFEGSAELITDIPTVQHNHPVLGDGPFQDIFVANIRTTSLGGYSIQQSLSHTFGLKSVDRFLLPEPALCRERREEMTFRKRYKKEHLDGCSFIFPIVF
jgi:hypothetical protein